MVAAYGIQAVYEFPTVSGQTKKHRFLPLASQFKVSIAEKTVVFLPSQNQTNQQNIHIQSAVHVF